MGIYADWKAYCDREQAEDCVDVVHLSPAGNDNDETDACNKAIEMGWTSPERGVWWCPRCSEL